MIAKMTHVLDRSIGVWRTLAWLILSIGMTFDIFVVHNASLAFLERVWVRPTDSLMAAYQRDASIKTMDLSLVCVICIVTVSLTVALDYYLRAGEQKGRLLRRIGLAAAIEAGIFLVGQIGLWL